MILSTGTHASNAEDVFLANVSELVGISGTGDALAVQPDGNSSSGNRGRSDANRHKRPGRPCGLRGGTGRGSR